MIEKYGLHDVYSAWHVPFWQTSWFKYTIVATCFVTLVFLLYILIRLYLKRRKSPLPIWTQTILELKALQNKRAFTKEEIKHNYFALTHGIKTFLIYRYSLPLKGVTDTELIDSFKKRDDLHETSELLQQIYEHIQLIKYADEKGVAEQFYTHVSLAIALVEKSIPTDNK